MKFKGSLYTVKNIDISKEFYQELLGQKIKYDFGENVTFDGDFSIQESSHFANMITIDENTILSKSNNSELYFETDDIEEFIFRLKSYKNGVQLIHDILEHPWGQRVIRFYDPDFHIVEVGESMESVVLRLHSLGNSVKKISKITQHPEEFVINAIGNKIIIETERLIIREPIIEDFDHIWSMRNDEEVTLFTGGVTKLSKEEIYERHLKRCKDFEDKPKEYSVVLKETNEYIGYCGFQYCDILEGIEILYGYSKKHWGKGYASEAAAAVLKFGIESLNLSEIVAAVNSKNVASEKVLLHIGMKYVGEIQWFNQGFVKKYMIKNDDY